ncbi:bestrophin family protein [Fibrella aquatilis]|uniref:Bestrophin n=1 Tax=Fibrella aquatilis TaxID=2817059 RepID=A0A939G6Q1_9BACT|nr:bestrophin family ion channel [Fibrella aquatilis]MBO0932045.1 hypothetical protein [Fibrella aquatilis]
MIIYQKDDWFQAIWHFHSGRTALSIFKRLSWVLAYLIVVTIVELHYADLRLKNTPGEFLSGMGILLSLMLVFRTNTAYDRFYEGRRAWGTLVNTNRTLATYLNALLPATRHNDRLFFAKMLSNFSFALKNHLRNSRDLTELEDADGQQLSTLQHYDHLPNGIMAQIQVRKQQLYTEGLITDSQLISLDSMLSVYLDVSGICERIKSTPIPFSYSFFIKLFILLYVGIMPFTVIDEFGYLTIPAVMAVSYVLVGLEIIGEEIQQPFGTERNNLPLNQLSRMIRLNIHEIMQLYMPPVEKDAAKPAFLIVD